MQTIEQQLARIDINLLIAFQVLMRERSVTRAAEHLFISQSAMSAKLQHLRTLFDDPLFIRKHDGLLPTPKAERLASPISIILSQLFGVILKTPFTPAQASGTINIQIPDSFSVALIPPLYLRLQQLAPELKLTFDNTTAQHLELLAGGKADFSIYVEDEYGPDFITTPLGHSSTVCWMRSGHPLAGAAILSLDDICRYPLVELTQHTAHSQPQAGSPTIQMLTALLKRHRLMERSRVGSTQLLTLLSIVLASDTLLLGAPDLSKFISQQSMLTYRTVAEYQDFQIRLVLIQHRRTEGSAMHTWLKEQIVACWAEIQT